MLRSDALDAMMGLGFTALEAQVYAALLAESPTTGYRVAQLIGKPAANTYKSLQTLEGKGAIAVEGGDPKRYVPTPLEDLLEGIARQQAAQRALAASALRELTTQGTDDRVHLLRTAASAEAKAVAVIDQARSVVVATMVGVLVPAVLEALVQAAARGADVAVAGSVVGVVEGIEILAWDGDGVSQVQVVADGRQSVNLVYGPGGEFVHGSWTSSEPLAQLAHQGIAARLCLLNVAERVAEGAGPKRMNRALNSERRWDERRPPAE